MPRLTPKESDKRPIASWSNGKELDGTDSMFRGFFVDVGLDAALDAACADAGWAQGRLSVGTSLEPLEHHSSPTD